MSAAETSADDGAPSLRADTLAALRAFLDERAVAEAAAAREAEDTSASLLTTEDWELSQFWYDEDTSRFLAAEVSRCAADARAARARAGDAEGDVVVAFLSSPSAFKALRAVGVPAGVRAVLFEYDPRFSIFAPDFYAFDYKSPLALPAELRHGVDVFLLDPPFLNAECLDGFAAAVRALSRGADARVLLASGAVMLSAARAALGLRPTRRVIAHASGRLSNPFALYTNYERDAQLGGWDVEAEDAAGATA